MLGSQGLVRKQKPWDESIRVPFLLRWPARFGQRGRELDALIDTPDIMPTLLGLCGLDVPATVEGGNFAPCLEGGADPSAGAALIACYHPFGEWHAGNGGREFRGLRTPTHTYVRSGSPWLLYDSRRDPYQLDNLINRSEVASLQADLEEKLQARLDAMDDEFLTGTSYIEKWGYQVDDKGNGALHGIVVVRGPTP